MSEQVNYQLHFKELPGGTVTFLFTDIEGSTRLLEQLRDQYATLMADQRRILREAFDRWHGQEVDTQGDAFFVAFPRATEAVSAAAQIQRSLAAHKWPEDVDVRVRMGLHTGEPLMFDEGYVGMDVHRAARIAHVGHGDQVLLSETTAALIFSELPEGVSLLDLGRHLLKDMRRPEHIRQLVIEDLPSEFPPLKSLERLPPAELREPRQVGACPYRGLAAFREGDAQFFYGRETFTERLETSVKTKPLVAVIVGSSGSGKSSAVFAGLLPRLRQTGGWQITVTRPGDQPYYSLASTLSPLLAPELGETDQLVETRKLAERLMSGEVNLYRVVERILEKGSENEQLLLVIDQFEELYTLCPDVDTQQRFIDELLSTEKTSSERRPSPVVILLTMRADFMGQALSHRPFADALQDVSLILGPMTRQELQAAIQKPAEQQGAAFEPGLVERILDDVGAEPGNLPLLEFALTLLWERESDGWLTHENYEEIGCVDGALASYADEVYTNLDETERETTRQVFVQLVRPGEGTEDTRRVASYAELGKENWELVQHLADSRLVVTGRDAGSGEETVEVVHEALIQRWARLREWIEADRAFRTWQERLRVALRGWELSEQDAGAVLRGAPLITAENWLNTRGDEMTETERDFIHASVEFRERRQRERDKRRRRIIYSLGAGLVVALLLTIFALNQRGEAFDAQEEALQAYSLSLAAHVQNSLGEYDSATALALAMALSDNEQLPAEAIRVLREAAYAPGARKRWVIADTFDGMEADIYSLEISPTELVALLGFEDGTVILWDIETETEILRLEGHTGLVRDFVFSSDGLTALSASNDHTVILWDLATGQEIRRFEGHSGWVRSAAFSPDGLSMASGAFVADSEFSVVDPGELVLWDLATGQEIRRFEGHPSGVQNVTFSPDGSSILASSGIFLGTANEYSMILWDVESGEMIRNFDSGHDNFSIAISPDGTMALTGGNENMVFLFDLQTGEKIQTYEGHETLVTSVAFTPDGNNIITGDQNGRVILWDLQTGAQLMNSNIHGGGGSGWSNGDPPMLNVGVGPQGRVALSSSEDNTLILWDLTSAGEVQRFSGHQDITFDVVFTPDGSQIVTGGASISSFGGIPALDSTLRLWDAVSGELIREFVGHTDSVFDVAISPDGNMLISGAMDGTVRLWDLHTGVEQLNILAHTGGVMAVVFSPDGSQALSGSTSSDMFPDDGTILWDLSTGERLHHLQSLENETAMFINPDGLSAYASGDALTEREGFALWSLETGEILRRYSGQCCTSMAVHPDGNSIFIVDNATTILQEWDLENDTLIREFGEHGGNRTRVEVSADGSRLLSSAVGGTLYLWDLETGNLIRSFSSNADFIIDIDMSADGLQAVSPGPYGTAILWDLDLPVEIDEVLAWISANRYVRDLTCPERATYSITPLCEG